MKHILPAITALAISVLTSCGPAKDIIYVQDLPPNTTITLQSDGELRAAPGDRVSVIVHSRDQELANMFNLNQTYSSNYSGSGNMRESQYFTVDRAGNIDMPILGKIQVDGLTRLEIADMVKYKLLSGSLLRDPVVTVEFPRMAYYIIGESGVGRHEFPDDRLNLLEALSISGDLNIHGRRTNIRVIRTEGDTQTVYQVDLTKTDDLYASPAYYVRQNDMIYIEPNQVKQNQSTANGSSYMTPTFWISMLTFASTIAVLFVK
jgi:polysaccharide export outer membrane protein